VLYAEYPLQFFRIPYTHFCLRTLWKKKNALLIGTYCRMSRFGNSLSRDVSCFSATVSRPVSLRSPAIHKSHSAS